MTCYSSSQIQTTTLLLKRQNGCNFDGAFFIVEPAIKPLNGVTRVRPCAAKMIFVKNVFSFLAKVLKYFWAMLNQI